MQNAEGKETGSSVECASCTSRNYCCHQRPGGLLEYMAATMVCQALNLRVVIFYDTCHLLTGMFRLTERAPTVMVGALSINSDVCFLGTGSVWSQQR